MRLATVAAAVLLAVAAGTVVRANTQTYVLGVASGLHGFYQDDDVRTERFDEERPGRYIGVYGEYYALGDVGFGLRWMQIGGSDTVKSTTAGGAAVSEETAYTVDTLAITGH